MAETGTTVESRPAARPVWRLAGLAACLAFLVSVGYLLAVAWVHWRAPVMLELARKRLAEEEPAEARSALAPLLWFQPRHAEALMLSGRSWAYEGHFAAAAASLALVPADSPQHESAEFAEALAYISDGRLDLAERILRSHLVRYPHNHAAGRQIAWLMYMMLRNRELEDFLAARLERFPDDGWLLVNTLDAEFRPQHPREAQSYLEDINQRHPGQASVARALAYCKWQLGDLPQASRLLRAALAAHPNDTETRLLAASFFLETGELEAARNLLAPFRVGHALAGEDPLQSDDRWWFLRSNLAAAERSDEQALEFARRAVELRPYEQQYVQRLATLLQSAGHSEEARRYLNEASRLEQCRARLVELVTQGAIDQPTSEVSREVAELCRERGRPTQAVAWQRVAERIKEGSAQVGSAPDLPDADAGA